MPAWFSLIVPGGLALFAAVVGILFLIRERRSQQARENSYQKPTYKEAALRIS